MLSPQLRVVFWEIVAPWRGKASLETVGHWECLRMLSWALSLLLSLPPVCPEGKGMPHVPAAVMWRAVD